MAPPAAVSDLAPTGKLRAVINFGNPTLAKKDPVDRRGRRGFRWTWRGSSAKRLGVEAELVTVTSAGQSVEVLAAGRVDVGFFAIDPARAATTAFTGPYVQIEGVYLVRNDSPDPRQRGGGPRGHPRGRGQQERLRPLPRAAT